MILIIGCTSKPSYALNDFGVYICETIPTTKWFRIEMWRGEKKIEGQKSYGVCEKFGGCMRNLGMREKFEGCVRNLGDAQVI